MVNTDSRGRHVSRRRAPSVAAASCASLGAACAPHTSSNKKEDSHDEVGKRGVCAPDVAVDEGAQEAAIAGARRVEQDAVEEAVVVVDTFEGAGHARVDRANLPKKRHSSASHKVAART